MNSVFRTPIGVSFYETQIGQELRICEAGYEECLSQKPYEFIPIDYYVVHYCVKGEGILQIQGQTEHIGPGDLFLIPADTQNKYYPMPQNPWAYCWVGIRGTMAKQLLADCGLSRENFFLRYHLDDALEKYFERIFWACKLKQDFSIMSNFYGMLNYIKTNVLTEGMPALSQSELHFQELLRYIHQHYNQDISVASMAQESSFDRTYIFKLFQKYRYTSPSRYILEYRLKVAGVLLRKTSLTIAEISQAAGFQNPAYFTRQFTRQNGINPTAYRRQFIRIHQTH